MENKFVKSGSTTNVEYESNIKTVVLQQEPEIKDIHLKLPKKVHWSEDTVDNEHMQKKKSKSIPSII